MYKLSRWLSCKNTPPKEDGVYLVIRCDREGELAYAAQLSYTKEWGWNTDEYSHEWVMKDFDEAYKWCKVTEERRKRK